MSKENIAISVISIGRNCIEKVEETFRSVINQNFHSFEYIIIDGNSTDGTIDKLIYLSNQIGNKNITIVSESDSGISDAMNKGVSFAKGELVFHLHFGDKLINENVLKKVWQSYRLNNWFWAAGNLQITKNGKSVESFCFRPGIASKLKVKNCVPHQSTFIRRDLFNTSGGFDLNLSQAMDYDLWSRLYFVHKIELFNLDIDVASFDSTGESSRIFSLLKGNWIVRKKMRNTYRVNTNFFEDCLFIFRIFIYWIFYKFKTFINVKCREH